MQFKRQFFALSLGLVLVMVLFSIKDLQLSESRDSINAERDVISRFSSANTKDLQISDSRNSINAERDVIPRFSSANTNSRGNTTMVLILTYMRSGSSFTGDILQQSTGAFYVYEPLRYITGKNSSSFTINYADGTSREPPFDTKKESVDVIKNWFTCNIDKLWTIGLMDGLLSKGIKSKMFPMCYNTEKRDKQSTHIALQRCVRQFIGVCEASPIRIIKTIRMEMANVKHLLEELPGLKIIHLVRDPRATLMSRFQMGWCQLSKGGTEGCTNTYCTRLENDLLEEESLKIKYPTRIKTVLYESIARNPLETSKEMYEFIGTEFTESAANYIYNLTMAGNKDNCGTCTTRSNSTEHIDEWKHSMQKDFVDIVNKKCNYVIKRFYFEK